LCILIILHDGLLSIGTISEQKKNKSIVEPSGFVSESQCWGS